MTDHTDTIRRAAESEHMTQGWYEFLHSHRADGDLSDWCVVRRTDALAVLAERQQAIDERDAALDELAKLRKRLPRCRGTSADGYRCSKSVGHSGPHSHPKDGAA